MLNRSQSISRIIDSNPDFILYTDAAMDPRVFALAHEKLAPFQGLLWGWGGTLGIPAIDYYFIPQSLWEFSKCATNRQKYRLPQELFYEQVRVECIPVCVLKLCIPYLYTYINESIRQTDSQTIKYALFC